MCFCFSWVVGWQLCFWCFEDRPDCCSWQLTAAQACPSLILLHAVCSAYRCGQVLIVDLMMCFSLVARDIAYLFLCLLAVCPSCLFLIRFFANWKLNQISLLSFESFIGYIYQTHNCSWSLGLQFAFPPCLLKQRLTWMKSSFLFFSCFWFHN